MNYFTKDIILLIWSFDNTYYNYFNKCIYDLNNLFKIKKKTIIAFTDYIENNNKNNISYILEQKSNKINNKHSIKSYWGSQKSNIYELEVYNKNKKIILQCNYIYYHNLLKSI